MNLCGWFPRVVSHKGLEERLSLILNALAECLPCSVHLSTQSSGCPHLWIRVWCSGSCCSTQPAASHSHACASSGLLAGGHRVRALCQLPGLVVVSSEQLPSWWREHATTPRPGALPRLPSWGPEGWEGVRAPPLWGWKWSCPTDRLMGPYRLHKCRELGGGEGEEADLPLS